MSEVRSLMKSHDLPSAVTCERCGHTNRQPATAESASQCGNCPSPLPWVVDADNDTFTDIVERSQVPVLRGRAVMGGGDACRGVLSGVKDALP